MLLLNFITEARRGGGGYSLTFGTGVLLSSNFLRPTNNQTDVLKDRNFQTEKKILGSKNIRCSSVPGSRMCTLSIVS